MRSKAPQLEVTTYKPFFSRAARVTTTFRLTINPSELSHLGFEFLKVSKKLTGSGALHQMKGRDERSPLSIPEAPMPIGDELFFYSVHLPGDEESSSQEEELGYYALTTQFQSFPSPGLITHGVLSSCSHPHIGTGLIWSAPIVPLYMRFSVDLYSSHHSSSLLASLPKVNEQIQIEASSSALIISTTSESNTLWKTQPVENTLYTVVHEILHRNFRIDISELYREKLR